MDLRIPEDLLREAGLSEHEALLEFACHLFDRGLQDLKEDLNALRRLENPGGAGEN